MTRVRHGADRFQSSVISWSSNTISVGVFASTRATRGTPAMKSCTSLAIALRAVLAVEVALLPLVPLPPRRWPPPSSRNRCSKSVSSRASRSDGRHGSEQLVPRRQSPPHPGAPRCQVHRGELAEAQQVARRRGAGESPACIVRRPRRIAGRSATAALAAVAAGVCSSLTGTVSANPSSACTEFGEHRQQAVRDIVCVDLVAGEEEGTAAAPRGRCGRQQSRRRATGRASGPLPWGLRHEAWANRRSTSWAGAVTKVGRRSGR